jgi:hypothetical protein
LITAEANVSEVAQKKRKASADLSGTAAMAAGIIPTPDAEEYLEIMNTRREESDVQRDVYMLPVSSISAAAPTSLSGVERWSSCPMRRFSKAAWVTCPHF